MDYYGYTDYGYTDYDAAFGLLGGIAIIGLIAILISLAVYIIQIIGLWKVFKKSGKGGWEAIVPFYCNWVLVEISGLNWWWFLFFFAPLVLGVIGLAWLGSLAYLFAVFNCYYNISKKFNKGTGFAVCLTLFTPICIPILGFSKNNVYNNVPVSNNGVFAPTESNTTNDNVNYAYQNTNNAQPMYNNTVNNSQSSPVQNNFVNNDETSSTQQNITDTHAQQFSFCGNCGTKLDNNVRFCPNCGKERV
ncbi:MAG: zinc ribbon domain-containing protein [Bacilli bacterium]|nr:zinc ribbon domain-containing protein [Bacilli bacterium]